MTNQEFLEFKNIKFYFHPFSKFYLASRCGKILSLKCNNKKILKLCLSNNYLIFNFYENKKRSYYVHRFVYETFNGKIPVDKQVDHIDSCKENNSITNLQLLTQAENTRKSHFKKVISFDVEKKEKIIFDSLKEVSEYHKLKPQTISMNCSKKTKISKSKKDGKKYQFFYL